MTGHLNRSDPAPGVAMITIDRPEVRNALGRQSWIELAELATEVAHDQRVRAVVLTGGDSFFSAGGDIKSMAAEGDGPAVATARLGRAHEAFRALHDIPQPLIAAVEGFAIGAGWSLALACDLVTAADDAYFQVSYLDRAIVADGGFAAIMTEAVGRFRTMELLLSRRRIPADEAARLNVVSAIVDPGRTTEAALEQARAIAELPAEAVQLTKQLVRETVTPIGAVLRAEQTRWALAWHSPNAAEGRTAFLEKRPPRFNRYLDGEG